MAFKKLRFHLEMEDGVEARTIDELREHFSMERVLLYYSDGRLLKWLRNNYLVEEAEAISELDPNDTELNRKICEILDVGYDEATKVSIEEVTENKQRFTKLKDYTSDKRFYDVIDRIAFDQSELDKLLDKGTKEIYLCGDRFNIPLDKDGISYIGVNETTAVIDSEKSVDFKAKGICFQNVKFDEKYLQALEDERINADFSGTAEMWVAPRLRRCNLCATEEKDIEETISKYTKLGYVHYSMYLTDFQHDKFYGDQGYTKERHDYGSDSFIFRNVISMIADNMKYIKNLVDLSREGLTNIKDMNSSDGYGEQAIEANYVKYSGIMLFNYLNNDIYKFHRYVFRLGILVPEKVNEKIISRGIIKSFTDSNGCHDYHCLGYILPFDDIKKILLNIDTVLLNEDGWVANIGYQCINGGLLFRDKVTNNPWLINSYTKLFDGSQIKYSDDE